VRRLSRGQGWQDTIAAKHDLSQSGLLFVSFIDASAASIDMAVVRALRRLTARFMLRNADDCEICNGMSFRILCDAQGLGTPDDFCRKVILPVGVEAESLVMNAIVPALGISLRVAILDRGGASGLCFEDYEAPRGPAERVTVHLQLRPGHYDLLYWQDPSAETLSPMSVRQARPVTFGIEGADCEWNVQQLPLPPSESPGESGSEVSTLDLPPGGSVSYHYHQR